MRGYVRLEDIVVYDPATRILYGIEDLNPVPNGNAIQLTVPNPDGGPPSRIPKPPRGGGSPLREKRKPTPYMKAKAKHFKRIQSRYKKKSGGWRKGGFGACSREAGRLAKAELKKKGGRKR